MRGVDERGCGLFSYVDLEARVPADHPLRAIRVLVDEALAALAGDFAVLYSRTGRPSIAPEKLLRALLLQAFYTIRSERQLMEQLDYNLLFRWFVGLSMDPPVWDATVYSKNRDRLVAGDVAARFLQAVLDGARARGLLSDEHFSVNGTPIGAWASMKSFRRSTRHPGYAASQKLRKRIEEGFGWIKTTGGLARTRHRGLDRVGWMFALSAAACHLVRLPKLIEEAPT